MVGSNIVLSVVENDPPRRWPAGVEIIFKNVTCSVKSGFNYFTKDRKEILHGVSGEFQSGELTAIVGPSGAGKSTLLNVLAGYKENFSGEVTVEGGTGRNCYIMQEENLHPLLTVIESMSIAASLKLGSSVPIKERDLRVNEILNSLGLSRQSGTLAGNLSGGQRKRLGIALELIDNPKIMFFDEPTSGLDSSSTKQCINLLKDLSREGRAVVCTLHQPSATIFSALDHVYCLAAGVCTFNGSPANLTVFLADQGLICPQYHSPVDFLMEVCSGEYGDHVGALAEKCQNGKSYQWRKRLDSCYENPTSCPLMNDLGECPKAPTSIECGQSYPTSFLSQTLILVKRIWITLLRDQFLMHSRLMIHASIGILIGTFFYNIGIDAGQVFSNYNVLFFSILFLAFSALQSMAIAFPLELPIIRKEHFNCWYSVKSYYLASTLADLPIQVTSVLIYCSIVYWMSGQPHEWIRFTMFTFMAVITSLLSQTIGYLVGASMKVMNGVMFGPMSICPWVLFSGFFLQANDAPDWAYWLYTISWMRRGVEGLTASVYGYSRAPLPCISEDYCHFVSPKKFLKELDLADHSFGFNVMFLVTFTFVLKYITYIVLIYQLRTQR